MKNMTVIPPKPQKGNAAAKEEVKRLRVAAYCRVSTDNEEQASSYEAQIQHDKLRDQCLISHVIRA